MAHFDTKPRKICCIAITNLCDAAQLPLVQGRESKAHLIDGMRVVLQRLEDLHAEFPGTLNLNSAAATADDESHHAQHSEHEDGPRRQLQQVVRLLCPAVTFKAGGGWERGSHRAARQDLHRKI